MSTDVTRAALIGGTGAFGSALALRLALAGVRVHLGSRDTGRAAEVAASLRRQFPAQRAIGTIDGGDNATVAGIADIVFLTVPFTGLRELLGDLRLSLTGRVVVSAVVPLTWGADGPSAATVPEGSAAELAAALLPESRVVAALHSVSSAILKHPQRPADADVLITGDDAEAKAMVSALVERIAGVRAVDAGSLRYARHTEELAVLLLNINRIHRAHAGVVITDLAGR